MNKKQSLFHIAKRDTLPWYKSFAIRGCAILLALVVCAVVTMLLTGENPVNIFATIFKGAFGSARKSWVTFQNLAVLLGISLAVTPAFKMRFWNIGAEGQVLIGCLATAACMICLADKLPNAMLILVSLAAALAAGALWGFLPAFFKAKWNTNETLFTLMMNYIATQLAAFFIIVWEVPKGAGKIGIINQGTEAGWLPVVGGQKYLLVILVVAVLTVFMYIYLNYSKHGYEIAVVGESQRTASYAGIKVERVIVRTMVLSGAVCGLMGLLLTAGTDHTLTTAIEGGKETLLRSCEYFNVNKLELDGTTKLTAGEGSFNSLLVLDGAFEIAAGSEKAAAKKGDSLFITAGTGEYTVTGKGTIILTDII